MMKAYPEYKDSGVEWLGEIPIDWKVKKLKYICDLQTGDQDTVNANPDAEYDFFVRAQKIHKIASYSHDCEAVLTAGDGVGVGKVYHYTTGKFNFHQRVYMMNNFKEISGRYFYYYLRTLFARVALDGGAKSTVDSLRMPTFTNFHFSYPNITEQNKLVEYLNQETNRIDLLISEKENFISLLKEKRQTLISHVVTKGLNDNIPMKSSGIEWIGDVPEHWGVKQFRHIFSLGKGLSITKENLKDSGIPCVNYGEIHSKYNFELDLNRDSLKFVDESYLNDFKSSLIGKGDFVFADTSEDLEGSGNFTHIISEHSLFAGYHTVIARLKQKHNSRYLSYLMDSECFRNQLRRSVKGVKVFSITQKILKETKLVLPSLEEQNSAVTLLDNTISTLYSIETETLNSIELLKERHTALISAAVTGKIDLRDVA